MYRRGCSVHSFLLVVVTAGSVVVSLNTSASIANTTHQEIVMSLLVNQNAILKNMNESSSFCASRDTELREIRLLKEEARQQLQAMGEEAKGNLQRMMEVVEAQLQTLEERKDEWRQAVEEKMEKWVQTMEERLLALEENVEDRLHAEEENAVEENVEERLHTAEKGIPMLVEANITTPQDPDPPSLDDVHNDTETSLCYRKKVLYGGRGSLTAAGIDSCEWHVVLPKGTRPVFRWENFRIPRCMGCQCGYLKVYYLSGRGFSSFPDMCGSQPAESHPMYNITSHEFKIKYHQIYGPSIRSFKLHYSAVPNT